MAELILPVETISVSGSLTIASNTGKDASSFDKITRLQDALKAELENFAPNVDKIDVALNRTTAKSSEVSYKFKIEGTVLMTDPMLVAENTSNGPLVFNGYLNGEDIIHFLKEALDSVMFGTNERWKRYAETTGDKSKLDETFSVVADELDHLMFEDQIFPRVRLLSKYDEATRKTIMNSWVDDFMTRDLTDLGIDNAAKLAIVNAISEEKGSITKTDTIGAALTTPGPDIGSEGAVPGGKTIATLVEAAKYANPTDMVAELDDLEVDELTR